MELEVFKDYDFSDFWEDTEYSMENYLMESPSDDLISSIELELGYKFPNSYVELMKLHNGGVLKKNIPKIKYTSEKGTNWIAGAMAIVTIMGIGKDKTNSIGGEHGSKFWITEWEYPDIGIYFGETPTGGHDMILLDYSSCGRQGEPSVVRIEQDGERTIIAKDFKTFVRLLDMTNDNR